MAAGKTDVLLLLLNKLMEDGNILYKVMVSSDSFNNNTYKKNQELNLFLLFMNFYLSILVYVWQKNRIKEASQRYQYALKKFPKENSPEEAQTFRELRLNFLLNLSRCKRKMNVSIMLFEGARVSITLSMFFMNFVA